MSKSIEVVFFLIDTLKSLPEEQPSIVIVILAVDIPKKEKIDQVFVGYKVLQQAIFTGSLDDYSPLLIPADIGWVLAHQVETISLACRKLRLRAYR